MGINTLPPDIAVGDPPTADNFNAAAVALSGDVCPRNATTRAVQDSAGSLGTSTARWREVHSARLYVGGVEILPEETSQSQIHTGVIGGAAPANRDGCCGWMVPAGANGITLVATAAEPLTVTLAGGTHALAASLTGGTPLPSAIAIAGTFTASSDPMACFLNDSYAETRAQETHIAQGGRPEAHLISGSPFAVASIDEEYGDQHILKLTAGGVTGYIVADRAAALGVNLAVAAQRGVMNHATVGWEVSDPQFNDSQAYTVLRTGYIFVDPTTAPWGISIEPRIVGASFNGPAEGSMTPLTGDHYWDEYRHRWYRWSGSAWEQTNRIYAGICAIGSSGVEAVLGVRSQETNIKVATMRGGLYGQRGVFASTDPALLRATYDSAEELLTFYRTSQDSVQRLRRAVLHAQAMQQPSPVVSIETNDSSNTIIDGRLHYGYVDLFSGAATISPHPPIVYGYPYPILLHPQRGAVCVGTLYIAADGTITAGHLPSTQVVAVSGATVTEDLGVIPNHPLVGYQLYVSATGPNPSGAIITIGTASKDYFSSGLQKVFGRGLSAPAAPVQLTAKSSGGTITAYITSPSPTYPTVADLLNPFS